MKFKKAFRDEIAVKVKVVANEIQTPKSAVDGWLQTCEKCGGWFCPDCVPGGEEALKTKHGFRNHFKVVSHFL